MFQYWSDSESVGQFSDCLIVNLSNFSIFLIDLVCLVCVEESWLVSKFSQVDTQLPVCRPTVLGHVQATTKLKKSQSRRQVLKLLSSKKSKKVWNTWTLTSIHSECKQECIGTFLFDCSHCVVQRIGQMKRCIDINKGECHHANYIFIT